MLDAEGDGPGLVELGGPVPVGEAFGVRQMGGQAAFSLPLPSSAFWCSRSAGEVGVSGCSSWIQVVRVGQLGGPWKPNSEQNRGMWSR